MAKASAERLDQAVKSCKWAKEALEPGQGSPKGHLPAKVAGGYLENAVRLLWEAAAELDQAQAEAFLAPVADRLAAHAARLKQP